MKKFLDEDFLLNNQTAKELYFDVAKDMPIFDFHNHLSAQEIYEDRQFDNITQVWLGGDHYKWRMMRTQGYTQEQIVGNETTDFEKFVMWAKTLENLFGNPLYHWTHLELLRYFGITEQLNAENAKKIYDECNEKLQSKEFSVRNLLRRMNVYELCTTNGAYEDLKYHDLIAKEKDIGFKVTPSFRPDFNLNYIGQREFVEGYKKVLGKNIDTFDELLDGVRNRVEYFVKHGCKITDHALDAIGFDSECCKERADWLWKHLQKARVFTKNDAKILFGTLMIEAGKIYHDLNLTQQYHIGAYRNANSRMFYKYGPDVGFDFIQDWTISGPINSLMDSLESTQQLPKTILYNLNPKDNDVLVSLAGCYQSGPTRGKIQYGSSWWFLDSKAGMERQIDSLANNGMLSTFIGMLTDSRSFLSYPRHEYFRRVFCNYIGEKVENGEFPKDMKYLSKMVADVCFYNAKNYLEGE